MAIWDDVISERDRQLYTALGRLGKGIGFGRRPALVIIDVNYNWVGDKPEPVLESINRFPASCGEEGWAAVHQIASLLPLARKKEIPIIYSTGDLRRQGQKPGYWPTKFGATSERPLPLWANDIVQEIAPQEGDIVIYKWKPSIFFGTPLLTFLNALQVDSLLMCGGATSGCVRASVVDAFSYNFRVTVIKEATFDRAQVSHKINLFDMNAKYADVLSIAEVRKYLGSL